MTIQIPEDLTKHDIARVFQSTAQAVGGDMIQAIQDCGEPGDPLEFEREVLYDYISTYGGEHRKQVLAIIQEPKNSMDDLESFFDSLGIPKTWD